MVLAIHNTALVIRSLVNTCAIVLLYADLE